MAMMKMMWRTMTVMLLSDPQPAVLQSQSELCTAWHFHCTLKINTKYSRSVLCCIPVFSNSIFCIFSNSIFLIFSSSIFCILSNSIFCIFSHFIFCIFANVFSVDLYSVFSQILYSVFSTQCTLNKSAPLLVDLVLSRFTLNPRPV